MDQAINTHDTELRALLLWMAVEAQLGDGAARKRFCEVELCSPAIGAELQRLHKERSTYVHQKGGDVSRDTAFRLVSLLRIFTLPESATRKTLIRRFEEDILDAQ
jgi:hypothetical protein